MTSLAKYAILATEDVMLAGMQIANTVGIASRCIANGAFPQPLQLHWQEL